MRSNYNLMLAFVTYPSRFGNKLKCLLNPHHRGNKIRNYTQGKYQDTGNQKGNRHPNRIGDVPGSQYADHRRQEAQTAKQGKYTS